MYKLLYVRRSVDLFVSRERSSIANRRRFPLKVFNHLVF